MDTILLPTHVMRSSHRMKKWQQLGSKDPLAIDALCLWMTMGMIYSSYPFHPIMVSSIATPKSLHHLSLPLLNHLSSTWQLLPPHWLMLSGSWMLNYGLVNWVTAVNGSSKRSISMQTAPHLNSSCTPFCFVDHKEQAWIRRQPVGSHQEQATLPGQFFSMD